MMQHKDGAILRGTTLLRLHLAAQASKGVFHPNAVMGAPSDTYSANAFPHTAQGWLHMPVSPPYTDRRLSLQTVMRSFPSTQCSDFNTFATICQGDFAAYTPVFLHFQAISKGFYINFA